jgi:hypothetical protein
MFRHDRPATGPREGRVEGSSAWLMGWRARPRHLAQMWVVGLGRARFHVAEASTDSSFTERRDGLRAGSYGVV